MWQLLEKTDDSSIVNSIIEVLTNLYVRSELDKDERAEMFREMLQTFVKRCSDLFEQATANPDWRDNRQATTAVERQLQMLIEIVDLSESHYPVDNPTLSSYYCGDKVSLAIENTIIVAYDGPKKIQLKVDGSATLREVKTEIATQLGKITWRNVRLVRPNKTPEIKEKHNSRTLRDMRVTLGEKLISQSKPQLEKKPELLTSKEGNLNPKADAAFREIFRRFCAGKEVMSPPEVSQFAMAVLEQKNISPDDIKVKDLIKQWDKDKDGCLSEEEFLDFYRASCAQKSSVVWVNLRTLGYGSDLHLKSTSETCSELDLASTYLQRDKVVMEKLFNLLSKNDEVAKLSWELLSRLPPIPSVINRIVQLEGVSADDPKTWESVIETSSVYKTLYCLYLVDYFLSDLNEKSTSVADTPSKEGGEAIAPTTSQAKDRKLEAINLHPQWRNNFIQLGGFVHLTKILNKIIHQGINSRTEMVLLSFLLKPVSKYILASVTLQQPSIFRNVAYINNGITNLNVLLGNQPKNTKKQVLAQIIKDAFGKEPTANQEVHADPVTQTGASTDLPVFGPMPNPANQPKPQVPQQLHRRYRRSRPPSNLD